jgi:hypothetical protein
MRHFISTFSIFFAASLFLGANLQAAEHEFFLGADELTYACQTTGAGAAESKYANEIAALTIKGVPQDLARARVLARELEKMEARADSLPDSIKNNISRAAERMQDEFDEYIQASKYAAYMDHTHTLHSLDPDKHPLFDAEFTKKHGVTLVKRFGSASDMSIEEAQKVANAIRAHWEDLPMPHRDLGIWNDYLRALDSYVNDSKELNSLIVSKKALETEVKGVEKLVGMTEESALKNGHWGLERLNLELKEKVAPYLAAAEKAEKKGITKLISGFFSGVSKKIGKGPTCIGGVLAGGLALKAVYHNDSTVKPVMADFSSPAQATAAAAATESAK